MLGLNFRPKPAASIPTTPAAHDAALLAQLPLSSQPRRGSAAIDAPADPPSLSSGELLGAGVRPLQLKPLTLDALVAEWRAADRHAAHAAIRLGRLADRWVRSQVEKRLQPDRAMAVKALRAALVTDGFAGEAIRVNRIIGVYRVAALLGADAAEQVPVTCLRALLPLIRRDKYDQWTIRTSYKDQTIALWSRIVEQHLSAAAVAAAVAEIRPPRATKGKKLRGVKIGRLIRLIGHRLTRDQVVEIRSACEKRLETGAHDSHGDQPQLFAA